jgi:hypothetical protein
MVKENTSVSGTARWSMIHWPTVTCHIVSGSIKSRFPATRNSA